MAKQQNPKYTHFKGLIKSNFEALDAQGAYHSYFIDPAPKEEITSTHRRLFLSIAHMANHYMELNPAEPKEKIYDHICRIEEEVSPLVEMVKVAKASRYTDSRLWGRMSDEFYHKVEDLSEHMQKPDDPKFSLEECITPHDLIRYFHQKGIDAMFHSASSAKEMFSYDKQDDEKTFEGGCVSVRAIDLDDSLKDCKDNTLISPLLIQKLQSKPLATVLSFYATEGAKHKPGNEDYKVLVTRDSINAHVSLGCHSAELNAQFNEQRGNDITLRFVNTTGYECSSNRNEYVRKVLRGLGFDLEEEGHITNAKMHIDEKDKAEKTLADLVRLIASTRDLDLSEGRLTCQENIDFAVRGFIDEGIVNVPKYLKSKCGGRDDY